MASSITGHDTLHFFGGECIKNKVFSSPPRDNDELRHSIFLAYREYLFWGTTHALQEQSVSKVLSFPAHTKNLIVRDQNY